MNAGILLRHDLSLPTHLKVKHLWTIKFYFFYEQSVIIFKSYGCVSCYGPPKESPMYEGHRNAPADTLRFYTVSSVVLIVSSVSINIVVRSKKLLDTH